MCVQAAQILLIMRPQNELPSDFQDYTLIALIAVAAHLSSHPLGSEDGINALANKYQQAPVDLRSVFNHILGQMSEYRLSTDMMRSQQVAVSYADTLQPLTADGASSATLLPLTGCLLICIARQAPRYGTHTCMYMDFCFLYACGVQAKEENPPASGVNDFMHDSTAQDPEELRPQYTSQDGVAGSSPDAFIAEVENIMRIPTNMAAANGGGLPEETVSEYDHRMAWVQQANGQVGAQGNSEANLALIENVRGWSELQKQLATADLAHKWRIDAVTARYQAHMEKVRPSFVAIVSLWPCSSPQRFSWNAMFDAPKRSHLALRGCS